METTDFLIIGAGIVGLSVARELRRRHPSARITVLEKEAEPGLHASGRNSGVLHFGTNFTPGRSRRNCLLKGREG
jgi:L-2-hydroxyglutarate oxidase LhgO